MLEQLYSPIEIAKRLDVDPRTVRDWIHRGDLRAVKAGRFYRVSERDLQAFLRDARAPVPEDMKGTGQIHGEGACT